MAGRMASFDTDALKIRRLEDAFLALALVLLWLWRLGAAPLFDVDEGAFAEATREMLASGDWLHTTLQGLDRFDKPILVYWLQGVSMALFGVEAWAARVPSALCAFATALVVGRFAAQRYGRQVGWLAAFVLSTCLGFLSIGRAATADSLLNLLLVLTGLSLWHFVESGNRSALYWASGWAGLGLLAKGPVALLVPGAAFCIWSMFHDRGRTIVRALRDPVAWCIVLAVALPWYAYAIHRHGDAFIQGFFMKHNVGRFTGPMQGHGGSWAYYLLVWPLLCLPWSVLLVVVLRRSRALWRDPLSRFLWIWSVFVLVFFSFSGTKLPHYLLYGTVPMVILMARALPDLSANTMRALWVSMMAICLLFAVLPWLAVRESARISHPLYRQLIATAPSAEYLWWGLAAAVGLIVLLARWRHYAPQTRLAGAAYVVAFSVVTWVVPWWAQTLQGPVRDAALLARQHPGKVVQMQLNLPSFAYYRGDIFSRSEPQAGDWVFLPAHALTQLKSPWTAQFLSRGLALVRIDPARPAPAPQAPGG